MNTSLSPAPSIAWLAGVDGGGTKTLVRIAAADGRVLAEAAGPGSALRNGAGTAWRIIVPTIEQAFIHAGQAMPPLSQLAVGVGIAGYNVAQWAADFHAAAPAFGMLQAATDGITTLLGAHQGKPGAVIAVGTGTIGIAADIDGRQRMVDGWGFPSGDDASGAWMGMRAIHHTQHAIDGRAARGPLAEAVLAFCAGELPAAAGGGERGERETVLAWLSQADQAAFARLARLVVAHAGGDDAARAIMQAAADEIELMAGALDPQQRLPLALCGGLAGALNGYLSSGLRQRVVAAAADAADGALLLARQALHGTNTLQE
ncbi:MULTISPECIES: BadF/BadG/BcrA/BcrD ATPase family protein [unclassified Herbaspirillum]|uniref:BadF/BadG/BcrA/BcrD ATPase family protein n=1 Tax=unclassified Herbaspirillum TaxID=2624150 RepID=UPI00114DE3FB|nr:MULTISPECIES: BadF/BadG/BcrA/BcrD ATPase family protein [unclassified Herbaspirillum]MBB5390003.1 glucosamine kinase [Herbaspirillum sp. SJZ102]TQK09493.1 glucosamine kinase [Herbaspirillum sp. SJZ130]TQK13820.1 glucosamine kinase [Herbaspirillum sp. SJZ106]TWC69542.1 glucosamine kinase [Herbaspirillum sp. SJZ099]